MKEVSQEVARGQWKGDEMREQKWVVAFLVRDGRPGTHKSCVFRPGVVEGSDLIRFLKA